MSEGRRETVASRAALQPVVVEAAIDEVEYGDFRS